MSKDLKLSQDWTNLSKFPEPGALVPPPAGSGWWFTVAAYVVAILAVICAPFLGGTAMRRAVAAVSLMASSFAVVWLVRLIVSRCQRLWTRWVKGLAYDQVYEIAAANRRELEAIQSLVRRFISEWPHYSEISVSVFGGRVLIGFSKKGNRALPVVGSILSLCDLEAGSVVGTFEVTTSDGKECQAHDRGDLDAVLSGFARNATVKFLPQNIVLSALPETDGSNE